MAHLAADLGANGGTVYLGEFGDGSVEVREVHRFDNRPVERDGRYVWDVEALVDGVVEGIVRGDEVATLDSVAVDTWGLDFGLVADGDLLRTPYSYRDPALSSTVDDLLATVSRREVFEATGINHWNTPNTLWQYHYLATEEPELLSRADHLLLTPQLLSQRLGGRPAAEATIASTTQMLDPGRREWATDLVERLDLPTGPLPPVEDPGGSLGRLDDDVAGRLDSDPDLRLTASHDTASAVAALPLDDDRAFVSTGTWFIVGVERDEPDRSRAAFEAGASNELGVGGTVRFLKNVNGFFLLEECREAWAGSDGPTDYDDLIAAARAADPFGPLVNPDDPLFGIEGEMPERIRRYCRETGQTPPTTRGETTRCIVESLAAATAVTVDGLLDVAGADADRLALGGGGVRNPLFCDLLASAADRRVVAGPAEATAVGNLLTQAVAAGTVADVDAGRRLVERTVDLDTYHPDPETSAEWERARRRLRDLRERTVGD
jgi:rhamnulokinase